MVWKVKYFPYNGKIAIEETELTPALHGDYLNEVRYTHTPYMENCFYDVCLDDETGSQSWMYFKGEKEKIQSRILIQARHLFLAYLRNEQLLLDQRFAKEAKRIKQSLKEEK